MNFNSQLEQLHITLRIPRLIVHKDYNTLSHYSVLTLQDLTVSTQRLIWEKDEKFLTGRWGIACPHPCVCWWQAKATRHEISHHFPQ